MHVLIGCAATPEAQESLYVYSFNEDDGRLILLRKQSELPKMSYLVADPLHNMVYAAGSEGPGTGFAAAYKFHPAEGTLSPISRQSTHGANAIYASLNVSGNLLFAVNFAGGNASIFPIDPQGALMEASQQIAYEGAGPVPQRQAGPHPHSIVPDPSGQYAIVADMGTDTLHIYKIDENRKQLAEHGRTYAEPGSGPRHLIFHPAQPYAYVINEINSSLSAYAYDASSGTLQIKQSVTTLPDDFQGFSKCADIQLSPCGSFLYGTNRGDDSIVVYRIGEEGLLNFVERVSSFGNSPRSVAISPNGSYLLAANEASKGVVIFRIDAATGKLTYASENSMASSPICIKFMV